MYMCVYVYTCEQQGDHGVAIAIQIPPQPLQGVTAADAARYIYAYKYVFIYTCHLVFIVIIVRFCLF